MAAPAPLRCTAPAKLNLFLHITGKRPDGYHELQSLAAFTKLGDEMELYEAPKLSLYIDGAFSRLLKTENTNTNLVMRAAVALQQQAGISHGAQIRLRKSLPVGAGLGGGSSDAAAALKGLIQLWKLSLGEDDLLKLALSLGSDVPACMAGKSAWVSGIGEQVKPVAMAGDYWLVLVNPNVPLLTADVYKKFSGPFTAHALWPVEIASFEKLVEIMQARHNDLEQPAITLLPVVADSLAALKATAGCAIARMSGSGATCFGLYASQQEAANAVRQIRSTQPKWWVQETQLLG